MAYRAIWLKEPLIAAIVGKDEKGVLRLLKAGAFKSLTTPGQFAAILFMLRMRSMAVGKAFIAEGFDVNGKEDDDATYLHNFVEEQDTYGVRFLLKLGADPNSRTTEEKLAPLHLAARGKSAAIAKALLAAGARVNARQLGGWMPHHHAAFQGHPKVLQALLEGGAPVNAKITDAFGLTALHAAALNGQGQCVEVLLGHGANPNAKDNNGDTPLHEAVLRGLIEAPRSFANKLRIAKMLLARGSDPTLKNRNGLTPFALAREEGFQIVEERTLCRVKISC